MPRRKSEAQAEEAKRKEEANHVINQKIKLIQMDRECPIIYDKGHPDNLNSEMKMVIWE